MPIDYKIIGSRIKKHRKSLKITQEELSEMLNISTSFESRVERGATKVSLELLTRISEVLGVALSYILTGAVDSTDTFLDEELGNIVKDFSAEQKRLLLDIARSIGQNIKSEPE